MKKRMLIPALAIASAILVFSCKKDSRTPGISYQLRALSAATPVNGRITGTIQWTAGFASADELKFEAENKSVEIEYRSRATKMIDLFSTSSDLGAVTVPPGDYKEIEYKIEARANNSEPAFELTGTYSGSSGTYPIIFRIASEVEFKTEQENINVTDGSTIKALTSLNLSLLTKGMTESMITNATLANGAIVISETSNANLYQLLLNNLHDCSELEID